VSVNHPTPGAVEERTAPILEAAAPTVDGRKLRGLIPYGVESRDLGGWTEVIDRGALEGADLEDLIATREHDRSKLLGRHPTTLSTEDRADGFAWAADLPSSPVGEDVRVAVERGDLRASSWRQVVKRDYWRGNVRHVAEIARLLDVTVTAAPAYATAAAELRSQPNPAVGQEDTMADQAESTSATTGVIETTTSTTGGVEDRSTTTTGLQVEDRVTVANSTRGLADEFRHAGFPGETATIPFEAFEDRAVTWTGSVATMNAASSTAAGLGYDKRWIWPLFARAPVDEGATSVDVPTQTARSLATAANVVRAIDAVTTKPETGSTVTIVNTPLNQVANKQSGIPNVFLESQAINSIVNEDLTLALNDGLDKLVLDKIALSGFRDPSTDNMVAAVRKTITVMRASGYSPNLLILTPAADEALDLLVSGVTGGTADYVFSPGQFGPELWGLTRRVSKSIPASAIVDTRVFGKLYASRVSLARFEENAGATNTSLIRLETHAVLGVERSAGAIRIAAA
jgi:HK97 family phage prohead protease